MAVKTITIDLEAYALLARHKEAGQSFSQVIKAHFGPQPTAGRFRALVRTVRLSEETLGAVEHLVRARRREPARAVRR
jgi:predicted CopG family antitoxin